jgi:glyoxylate/succinic semialdehyde reductase
MLKQITMSNSGVMNRSLGATFLRIESHHHRFQLNRGSCPPKQPLARRKTHVTPLPHSSPRRHAKAGATTGAGDAASSIVPPATSVGFLGLGIMGSPMALNLLKAGFRVTVWNRSADKCAELVAAGAIAADSPAAVVTSCNITVAMLADPAAAAEVALGPDGVAAAMRPGKGYIDVSTVDAATAKQIEEAIHERGGLFLEAPVSGSKGPAEQGQLIFLAAGDRALFDAAVPLLDAMGKASFFLGGVGAGANMKLAVNSLMGTMMASFAESGCAFWFLFSSLLLPWPFCCF